MSEETEVEEVPEATFEDIVEQYEQEEGEFEYTVGEGAKARRFRARRLISLQEKIELAEQAERFAQFINGKSIPADWKPYLAKRPGKKVCTMIIFTSSLLIRPKLSQLQCLRLAARGGDALIEIAGPLMGVSEQSVGEAESEALEDAKND